MSALVFFTGFAFGIAIGIVIGNYQTHAGILPQTWNLLDPSDPPSSSWSESHGD